MSNNDTLNYLRIRSSSKSRHQEKKENSWNNRFHVSKPPEYNPLNDRHLQYLLAQKRKKQVVFAPGRILPRRNLMSRGPSPLRVRHIPSSKQLMKPPTVEKSALKGAIDRLHLSYDSKEVDQQFRDAFLLVIDTLPQKSQNTLIENEIRELSRDCHIVQSITKAVREREECLSEIRDSGLDVIQGCVDKLRLLSVQVVEYIQKWRDQLGSIHQMFRTRVFLYDNNNYLIQMKDDTSFVSEALGLPNKEDPFLLNSFTKKRHRKGSSLPSGLLNRINYCASVLVNETGTNSDKSKKKESIPLPQDSQQRAEISFEATNSSTISREISEYSQQISSGIKDTLGCPLKIFSTSASLKFPALIWINNNGKRIGFLILNLEKQKTLQKRVHISHISCISPEDLGPVIQYTVDYIWKNYPCIEIRVAMIYYAIHNGKYETDNEIKSFFDNAGFRWKQMISDKGNSMSIQHLGLRRPETLPFTTPSTTHLFEDNIQMFYACLLQLDLTAEPHEKLNHPTETVYSLLGLSSAYKVLGKATEETAYELKDTVAKLQTGWVPSALRLRKAEKPQDISKDFSSLGLGLPPISQSLESAVSCFGLELNWEHFQTGVYKEKNYLKITNCEISIVQSGDKLVYIVPTEDPNFNLFFVPSLSSSFAYAKLILDNIVDSTQVSSDHIWIPAFEVKATSKLSNLISRNVNEYTITECIESVRFSILSPAHPLGSIQMVPSLAELIIEPPFIFGVLNTEVEEKLNIPYLVTHIQEHNLK